MPDKNGPDQSLPRIGDSLRDELTAVEAGHGPYYEELVEELGRFSVAGFELQTAQEEFAQKQVNLEFLRGIAELLPRFQKIGGSISFPAAPFFELDGQDATYVYRKLQTHVVWPVDVDVLRSRMHPGRTHYRPYFVIGQSAEKSFRQIVLGRYSYNTVLLLPAIQQEAGTEKPDDFIPILIDADSRDMIRRSSKVEGITAKELTRQELEDGFAERTGKLVLNRQSSGSIGLERHDYSGGPTEDKFNNVRYFRKRKHFMAEGVSTANMEELHVAEHIAELASAFRITEQVYTSLAGKEVLVQHDAPLQHLPEQSQALQATGLFDEEEIDRRISERYPEQ
jgi:hypothetical protein